MSTVPLIVFEEHNEAFFIWHYAIQQQIIPPSGNVLLHIDEHSDFGVPRLNQSLRSLDGNLQNIYNFTHQELTIENFIIPAAYQGLFKQIYWLRQAQNRPIPPSICIYAQDPEAKVLMVKSAKEMGTAALFNPKYKKVGFRALKVNEQFPAEQTVVLDIDLDYFSCNHQYYNFKGKIEITPAQYETFLADRYQFLRLTLGSGIQAVQEEDKYYLQFNEYSEPDNETLPNQLKVSSAEIKRRITQVIDFLKQHQVKPQLIDICRSRISGFTPADQWQLIETNLIEQLKQLYSLEVLTIDNICNQARIA